MKLFALLGYACHLSKYYLDDTETNSHLKALLSRLIFHFSNSFLILAKTLGSKSWVFSSALITSVRAWLKLLIFCKITKSTGQTKPYKWKTMIFKWKTMIKKKKVFTPIRKLFLSVSSWGTPSPRLFNSLSVFSNFSSSCLCNCGSNV